MDGAFGRTLGGRYACRRRCRLQGRHVAGYERTATQRQAAFGRAFPEDGSEHDPLDRHGHRPCVLYETVHVRVRLQAPEHPHPVLPLRRKREGCATHEADTRWLAPQQESPQVPRELKSPPQSGNTLEVSMTHTLAGTIVVGIILAGQPLPAHHSAATKYDQKRPVTLKGTVTKVEWMNPHVYYYIDVKDSSGEVQNWAVE